jgi:hypothetical protein
METETEIKPPLVDQPTMALTRKATAAAIASATVTIVVWIMNDFAGIAMPAVVQAAFQGLITIGAIWGTTNRALS